MKMTPWREENMEMCVVRIRAVKMSRLEGARPEIKCVMEETYFSKEKKSRRQISCILTTLLGIFVEKLFWTEQSAFQKDVRE